MLVSFFYAQQVSCFLTRAFGFFMVLGLVLTSDRFVARNLVSFYLGCV